MPRRLISILAGLAVVGAMIGTAIPASASPGTTYYVDNGAGCSDISGGTLATPWCDFHNLNAGTTVLVPGDSLLLKRGDTWTTMTSSDNHPSFSAVGSSSGTITIGAYGTGAAPTLQGDGTSSSGYAMTITDPSYLDVSSVRFTQTAGGLNVTIGATSHQNISVHGLTVDHANFTTNVYHGVNFAFTSSGTSGTVLAHATITDNTITNSDGGIGVTYGGNPISFASNTMSDVKILRNTMNNIIGPALDIATMVNSLIADNDIRNAATARQPQGTTAIFIYSIDSVEIVNNLVDGVPATGSYDQTAFDFEANISNTTFYGNYIGSTAGSGIEFLQLGTDNLRDATDHNTNTTLKDDVFDAVGASNGAPPADAYLSSPSGHTITGNYQNIVSTGSPVFFSNPYNGFTTAGGNLNTSSSSLYGAALGFSATSATTGAVPCTAGSSCWSYQVNSGSGYSSIGSYDTGNSGWGTSTNYISEFETLPAAGSGWTARAWTAPTAGVVSIRGWALKAAAGGDGVNLRITDNGSVVWPTTAGSTALAASDQVGVGTDLDGLHVAAGDVVRFEVSAGTTATSDQTSWAPTIAYTSSAAAQGAIDSWPLNEISGTAVHDVAGTDPGTVHATGSPNWTTGPTSGSGAVQLSPADSQYVSFPSTPGLSGMSQLTASVWVNMAALPASGHYFEPLGKDSGSGSYRFIIQSDGTGHFVVATTGNAWYSIGTAAPFSVHLAAGTWYHLVGTYDGSHVNVYIDGVLAGTGASAISGSIVTSSVPLNLGSASTSPIDYFNGSLSQAAVYTTALGPGVVEQLYDQQDGVLVSWPTAEGSGSVLHDGSGNAHDVSLVASPTWGTGFGRGTLTFNGSTQYGQTAGGGALTGTAKLSVSIWVNLAAAPASGTCQEPIGQEYAYRILICDTGPQFVVATTGNGWYTTGTAAQSATPLSAGTWHHLTGVYDGTGVRLYVDGTLAGSGSTTISGAIASTSNALLLAGSTSSNILDLKGSESTVRLYSRALSAQEVADLYALR